MSKPFQTKSQWRISQATSLGASQPGHRASQAGPTDVGNSSSFYRTSSHIGIGALQITQNITNGLIRTVKIKNHEQYLID